MESTPKEGMNRRMKIRRPKGRNELKDEDQKAKKKSRPQE
jgi:hypothetical protein